MELSFLFSLSLGCSSLADMSTVIISKVIHVLIVDSFFV